MKKKPAVTIYLRPNKAKDKYFLNVRYQYDRKDFPIPLGYSIKVEDWDSKRSRMHYDVDGSAEINGKLKDTIAVLEAISNKLVEEGKAPTIAVMKEAYQTFLQEQAHAREMHRNKLKKEAHLLPAEHSHQFERLIRKSAELRRLADELEVDKATLAKLNQTVLDKSREIESNFPDKSSSEYTNFFQAHKIAQLLDFGDATHPETSEDVESRKQFLAALDEYIDEKTGVGLNASKEEVRATPKATSGSNKGLRSWAKTLVEFTKSKQVKKARLKIGFNNLSQKFYDTYALFLQSPKPDGFDLFNNTFGGHVKKLKTFLKWVELDKQLPIDRRYSKFKVLTEEKEIIALTMEDINLLYEWEPQHERAHGDANPWRKYIDFTVFSFLTSLRISDIQRMKGFRFENGYIIGKTKKTSGNFKIPMSLDPRIGEILARYGNDMLLFSDVEYNRMIKRLLKMFFEQHGLYLRSITITRKKYIQPNPIEATHTFAELYTSHCNRRGWVSHFSRMFDDHTLMEMMGTKSHQEFLKYKRNNIDHLTEKVNRVLSEAVKIH